MKPRRNLITAGILFFLLALFLTAKIFKHKADARFFEEYDAALSFEEQVFSDVLLDETKKSFGREALRHFRRIEYTIQARPGEKIPALLALPPATEGKVPVVLFLHGSHQDKEFLDQIATPFTQTGFAMASFDQHMRGERKVEGKLRQILAYRERSWKTVNDARRILDYLSSRPDIDSEGLYLVGASYGAITGCTVVARDKRLKAAVLVVGGGNLKSLVNSPSVRDYLPSWARSLATPLIACLMRPAEPILYAPQTSPTPVLMQNGDADTVVTPQSGQALYDALGNPKEIRWYPCDHPGVRDIDDPVVLQILEEGLQWLLEKERGRSHVS